jgi:ATP-dependent exoDNAse (exonuclease V) alpha subunit
MHANLHIQTISRGARKSTVAASAYRSGSSVVACAAYRACDKLKDDRYDKTHDYSRKENVLHAEIITPDHAPEWMQDRQALWNAVEDGEKRKDAQLAKEVILVLPRNLDHEQHKEVVRGWVTDNVTRRDLIADFAIHEPDASDGGKNPHAHVMFTLRPVEQDGSFGKKLTGYQNGGLDGKAVLKEMRFSYEDHLNRASAANDDNQVVFDLRSYREKGIDKTPQPKQGQKVTHLEKRGYDTEWNKEVEKVKQINQAKAGHRKYIRTYSGLGGNNEKHATLSEAVRQDVGNQYYDIMYGDGTEGSYERENADWYGR